jgi:hypothetical protein
MAYQDTSQWPTHWPARAQHRMRSLGIQDEREAFTLYRTQSA